jgi:hypothetical protein
MNVSVELDQLFTVTDASREQSIYAFDNYVRSLTISGVIYELHQNCNKYKVESNYHSTDDFNIYSINKVLIIFPLESCIVLCPMNIAVELSGISLYLKYDNLTKYPVQQFKLYNRVLHNCILSPTIIVTELPSQSVTCPPISHPNNNATGLVTTIHSMIHKY